jgi:hypothetical protein
MGAWSVLLEDWLGDATGLAVPDRTNVSSAPMREQN